jgi:hypothetical protein
MQDPGVLWGYLNFIDPQTDAPYFLSDPQNGAAMGGTLSVHLEFGKPVVGLVVSVPCTPYVRDPSGRVGPAPGTPFDGFVWVVQLEADESSTDPPSAVPRPGTLGPWRRQLVRYNPRTHPFRRVMNPSVDIPAEFAPPGGVRDNYGLVEVAGTFYAAKELPDLFDESGLPVN